MPQTELAESTLEYQGILTTPAAALLPQRDALAAGLFSALAPLGLALADVHVDDDPGGSLASAIVAELGPGGVYRFTFDGVQWTTLDPDLRDPATVVKPIALGRAWLKSAAASAAFEKHQLTYAAHHLVLDGTVESAMAGLRAPTLAALGDPRPTGVVFRAAQPARNLEVELTVDRSSVYDTALFASLTLLQRGGTFDPANLLRDLTALYGRALAGIGITPPR
jgi:hypothetical protein